ncbi:Vacuolar protein sorting-associated protein 55 homolog [Striga hermonthica]|uniref:Vacuolar protein sorting-associated protein 55 homolog n=1 Tax=Striga hermonthica TaxID=68872 RepID=A0A9N7P3I1_STRHE|nr:Vacuolar protein sorting-associated protein 55 homolog [Striga hermonthica]
MSSASPTYNATITATSNQNLKTSTQDGEDRYHYKSSSATLADDEGLDSVPIQGATETNRAFITSDKGKGVFEASVTSFQARRMEGGSTRTRAGQNNSEWQVVTSKSGKKTKDRNNIVDSRRTNGGEPALVQNAKLNVTTIARNARKNDSDQQQESRQTQFEPDMHRFTRNIPLTSGLDPAKHQAVHVVDEPNPPIPSGSNTDLLDPGDEMAIGGQDLTHIHGQLSGRLDEFTSDDQIKHHLWLFSKLEVCCYPRPSSWMADVPRYMRSCLQSGKLAMLAILVSGGIVLQILACALYNNWWPMLTVLMYVLLPMPLIFFAGSDASSLYSESSSGWVDAAKFLTGASAVGSIAIPVILKHAGVIGWGALAMELSSYFVFVVAILCFMGTNDDDGYNKLAKLKLDAVFISFKAWFYRGLRRAELEYQEPK